MFDFYNKIFSMLYIHRYVFPFYRYINIYMDMYSTHMYSRRCHQPKITNNALILIATVHYFFFSLLSIMEYF